MIFHMKRLPNAGKFSEGKNHVVLNKHFRLGSGLTEGVCRIFFKAF